MAQRGEKQVAEAVPAQTAACGKAVLEETAQQRFIGRKRHHAGANVTGRENAVLAPQAAGAAAVVGDGHDRSEIANRLAAGPLPPARDVLLQSAQNSGKTRAAADRDNSDGLASWNGFGF